MVNIGKSVISKSPWIIFITLWMALVAMVSPQPLLGRQYLAVF
jgi:hypothetical protein